MLAPVANLVVERLRDELLVYDTESGAAHCLNGEGAAAFNAAPNDLSRRQVLRKLALAGAAAAGTGALVKSIAAPTAAQAQSSVSCPGVIGGTNSCSAGQTCCGTGAIKVCCIVGTFCCQGANGSASCCVAPATCCISTSQGTACCDLETHTCNATTGCQLAQP
jgi:hypothetical protein